MSLYLGNSGRLKIYLNGVAYHMQPFIVNNLGLESLDKHILTDSTGVVLFPDAITPTSSAIYLTLLNGTVLKDINGRIITLKESD